MGILKWPKMQCNVKKDVLKVFPSILKQSFIYFEKYITDCHHKCTCFTNIKRHILEIAEKHARYKILLTEHSVRKFMYFGTFHIGS